MRTAIGRLSPRTATTARWYGTPSARIHRHCRTVISGIGNIRRSVEMPDDTFDVVVIGAGVAGALIADALAALHVNVLLLPRAVVRGGDGGARAGERAAHGIDGAGAGARGSAAGGPSTGSTRSCTAEP